jgi:hypothetical protein
MAEKEKVRRRPLSLTLQEEETPSLPPQMSSSAESPLEADTESPLDAESNFEEKVLWFPEPKTLETMDVRVADEVLGDEDMDTDIATVVEPIGEKFMEETMDTQERVNDNFETEEIVSKKDDVIEDGRKVEERTEKDDVIQDGQKVEEMTVKEEGSTSFDRPNPFTINSPPFYGFKDSDKIQGKMVIQISEMDGELEIIKIIKEKRRGRPRGPEKLEEQASPEWKRRRESSSNVLLPSHPPIPPPETVSVASPIFLLSKGTSRRPANIYLLDRLGSKRLGQTKLPKVGAVLRRLIFLAKFGDHTNFEVASKQTAQEITEVWKFHFGLRLVCGKEF